MSSSSKRPQNGPAVSCAGTHDFGWVVSLFLLLSFPAGTVVAAQTSSPPVVQMLVPGFTVEELPVKLSNQNNLRFAPDGTLTTLGYDGRIWRLRDANGDSKTQRSRSGPSRR